MSRDLLRGNSDGWNGSVACFKSSSVVSMGYCVFRWSSARCQGSG